MFIYFRSFSVTIFLRERTGHRGAGAEAAEPIKFRLLLKNYGPVKDLIGCHCTKFMRLVTDEVKTLYSSP